MRATQHVGYCSLSLDRRIYRKNSAAARHKMPLDARLAKVPHSAKPEVVSSPQLLSSHDVDEATLDLDDGGNTSGSRQTSKVGERSFYDEAGPRPRMSDGGSGGTPFSESVFSVDDVVESTSGREPEPEIVGPGQESGERRPGTKLRRHFGLSGTEAKDRRTLWAMKRFQTSVTLDCGRPPASGGGARNSHSEEPDFDASRHLLSSSQSADISNPTLEGQKVIEAYTESGSDRLTNGEGTDLVPASELNNLGLESQLTTATSEPYASAEDSLVTLSPEMSDEVSNHVGDDGGLISLEVVRSSSQLPSVTTALCEPGRSADSRRVSVPSELTFGNHEHNDENGGGLISSTQNRRTSEKDVSGSSVHGPSSGKLRGIVTDDATQQSDDVQSPQSRSSAGDVRDCPKRRRHSGMYRISHGGSEELKSEPGRVCSPGAVKHLRDVFERAPGLTDVEAVPACIRVETIPTLGVANGALENGDEPSVFERVGSPSGVFQTPNVNGKLQYLSTTVDDSARSGSTTHTDWTSGGHNGGGASELFQCNSKIQNAHNSLRSEQSRGRRRSSEVGHSENCSTALTAPADCDWDRNVVADSEIFRSSSTTYTANIVLRPEQLRERHCSSSRLEADPGGRDYCIFDRGLTHLPRRATSDPLQSQPTRPDGKKLDKVVVTSGATPRRGGVTKSRPRAMFGDVPKCVSVIAWHRPRPPVSDSAQTWRDDQAEWADCRRTEFLCRQMAGICDGLQTVEIARHTPEY